MEKPPCCGFLFLLHAEMRELPSAIQIQTAPGRSARGPPQSQLLAASKKVGVSNVSKNADFDNYSTAAIVCSGLRGHKEYACRAL